MEGGNTKNALKGLWMPAPAPCRESGITGGSSNTPALPRGSRSARAAETPHFHKNEWEMSSPNPLDISRPAAEVAENPSG